LFLIEVLFKVTLLTGFTFLDQPVYAIRGEWLSSSVYLTNWRKYISMLHSCSVLP